MNLTVYSNFDLNHPVVYFPFGNLYTLYARVDEKAENKKASVNHVFLLYFHFPCWSQKTVFSKQRRRHVLSNAM